MEPTRLNANHFALLCGGRMALCEDARAVTCVLERRYKTPHSVQPAAAAAADWASWMVRTKTRSLDSSMR